MRIFLGQIVTINTDFFEDIFLGILYGLIQGLSEFLPVSSSGHLAILPILGEFKDPGIVFDLMLHIGTALAVICYFYKDLLQIISLFYFKITKKTKDCLGVNYFIATLASVLLAFVIKDFAQIYGRNAHLIAFNLAFFGLLLVLVDRFVTVKQFSFSNKSAYLPSFIIGVLQVLAIFPGVSRSGITIMGARFFGADRKTSSSFSFLLSLPLILGGAGLKVIEMRKGDFDFSTLMCVVGFLVSFVVGLLTIHFFMKLISKISFFYFFIYRLILAIILFWAY